MTIDVNQIILLRETNVGAVMVHEFGHAHYRAINVVYDWDTSNASALRFENAYRRAVRMPERAHHADHPPTGW